MSDVNDGVIEDSRLSWQIKLFMLSFLMPPEIVFKISTLRLTPYRVILLVFFVPCFLHVFKEKHGKRLASDWLLLAYACWNIVALSINHNISMALETGGILLVESFGAYLLARTYIRTEVDFRNFVRMLLFVVVLLTMITIPESLTGKNFIRPGIRHINPRMGLERACGVFEHPILYGVFCASILSLALYVPTGKSFEQVGHKFRTSWVVLATIMSVSSGALVSVIIQFILASWDKITAGVSGRWRIFTFVLVSIYFLIDVMSNRTPIRVILHRLTFSANTAYNRLTIWEWGTKYNVAVHPWFGIGMDVWVRPSWMHSTSMDNFWLVNMVRYGLPSFFFLAVAVLALLFSVGRGLSFTKYAQQMRTGWVFSLIGFIISGWTVHFWNSILVWFFFLLGSGAWMALPSVEESLK